MPGKIRLTIEFISEEFSKVGYKLLETEYIDPKKPLEYICNNGHHHKLRWNNFKSGQRCRECFILSQKYSINDIKEFLDKINFQLLTDTYKDNHQKLDVICDKGHNIQITFNKLKLGTRCKLCVHDSLRMNYEDVKKIFEENKCKLLTKNYINGKQKLQYKCKCGNISYTTYEQIKDGSLCGCQKSIGETRIIRYFSDNGIDFISQKTFPDCRNTQVLHFDFYVNNKFLLEFDGEQHFKEVSHFGGEKALKINMKHDKIKNEYCISNNIKLLRISYKEKKKITQILNDYILNFDKTDIITFSNKKLYETMKNNINNDK